MITTASRTSEVERAQPRTSCSVCGSMSLREVVRIPEVPTTIGACYATASDALAAPVGTVRLTVCEMCGLVRNQAFDERLVGYGPDYENSQMFSPRFREFAETLADDLVATYALQGGRVVEIGCGKGEFLRLLAERGVSDVTGYDTSYDGEVDGTDGIEIVPDHYGDGPVPAADLLVSRHVVEHLAEPREVLSSLRHAVGQAGTPLYVEVPSAEFVLTGSGMWDVIYPHVNYFAAPALRTLLERSGWEPVDVGRAFSGQFLAAHGRPSSPSVGARDAEVDHLLEAVADFGSRFTSAITRWPEELERRRRLGPVALWGAGSKGISFLCAPGVAQHVDAVVDVNPRKHGTYVPHTGHRVDPPGTLGAIGPTTVLITNPLYEDEIRAELSARGLSCELLAV